MSSSPERPALQVIVLGSGGGPREDNTAAFLVRSISTEWRRGSVLAVDAGTHLAAVARILERHVVESSLPSPPTPMLLTSGPFQGLQLPYVTINANAAHITQNLVESFLITHPHLDHISGFVVNTAGLLSARPKRLASLPSTIAALKAHIFNNIIWPNLSDENNGAGLVTYMRLIDGGSPALGNGDGKGYVEVCEGLSVKALSVSHGHCMENHSHRGSVSGTPSSEVNNGQHPISPGGYSQNTGQQGVCVYDSAAYFIRDIATGREVLMFGDVEPDAISLSPRNLQVWTAAAPKIVSGIITAIFIECSYADSQQDDQLYGHLVPRHLMEELRILANCTNAVRLDDETDKNRRKRKYTGAAHDSSQQPRRSPRVSHAGPPSLELPRSRRSRLDSSGSSIPHVHALDLGSPGRDAPISSTSRRIPRSIEAVPGQGQVQGLGIGNQSTLKNDSPSSSSASILDDASTSDVDNPVLSLLQRQGQAQLPLQGLRVYIIHVKERLTDGEPTGQTIMRQMKAYEKEARLGCEFILTSPGLSIYL